MDPVIPIDNAVPTSKSDVKLEISRTSSESPSPSEIKIGAPVDRSQYSISEAALELPPNAGGDGDDAFASEPSVFDEAVLAKLYWPRKDYEGLHRFFPDFKWTIGEEKR